MVLSNRLKPYSYSIGMKFYSDAHPYIPFQFQIGFELVSCLKAYPNKEIVIEALANNMEY